MEGRAPQLSGWPAGRSRHGGVDEIPLPGVPGRLWLCGKHFIGPDPEAAMTATGATVVVCLNEPHELLERYPDYVAWLERSAPSRVVWAPIPDLSVPDPQTARHLIGGIAARLRLGEGVLMHCGAGIGRAGTVAAAVLVELGLSVDDAVRRVADHRPMAGPEAGPQAAFLRALRPQQ